MSNPILDAARARLLAITAERAALDREERELRAMVAAAEGASAQPLPVAPAVPILPVLPVYPWSPSYPWTLGGEGWTSSRAILAPRYTCQRNATCGCGCNGFLWCSTDATDRAVLTTGTRAGDVVTLSGSCGAVSTFTASLLTSAN